MTPARRLLAFAQSQEQNIDNLIQAACKRLFALEIHAYDHTCKKAGRERAKRSQGTRDDSITRVSGGSLGRLCSGSAPQRRRSSNHLSARRRQNFWDALAQARVG